MIYCLPNVDYFGALCNVLVNIPKVWRVPCELDSAVVAKKSQTKMGHSEKTQGKNALLQDLSKIE